MALTQVHNISDRAQTQSQPKAFRVGGIKIRPGRSAMVDASTLNSKVRRLHGTHIWIGQLPASLRKTARSEAREKAAAVVTNTEPMTIQEVREYLGSLAVKEIMVLTEEMVPALTFKRQPLHRQLIARVSRAMFSRGRMLNPETFFWTRRWTMNGSEYVEK